MIVISTNTILFCIGTKRDGQYHRYLLERQSNFFACLTTDQERVNYNGLHIRN